MIEHSPTGHAFQQAYSQANPYEAITSRGPGRVVKRTWLRGVLDFSRKKSWRVQRHSATIIDEETSLYYLQTVGETIGNHLLSCEEKQLNHES